MADQLERLKLIQAVITRMAGNSFLIKAWAVTLVTGLAALAKATDGNEDVAWISLGVLFIFALLDAYYLALEKAYRGMYQAEADRPSGTYGLKLATEDQVGAGDVFNALGSFAIWPLYGAAAVGAILVAANVV
jgi:hypothetical protein